MLGPNISGSFSPEARTNTSGGAVSTNYTTDTIGSINGGVYGAFSFNNGSSVITGTGVKTGFTFNASSSNSLYKDSSSIQPEANQVLIIIKT